MCGRTCALEVDTGSLIAHELLMSRGVPAQGIRSECKRSHPDVSTMARSLVPAPCSVVEQQAQGGRARRKFPTT